MAFLTRPIWRKYSKDLLCINSENKGRQRILGSERRSWYIPFCHDIDTFPPKEFSIPGCLWFVLFDLHKHSVHHGCASNFTAGPVLSWNNWSPVVIVKVNGWIELSPISVSSYPAHRPHTDSAHPHIFDWQVIISSCLIHDSIWGHHLFSSHCCHNSLSWIYGPNINIYSIEWFSFQFYRKDRKGWLRLLA